MSDAETDQDNANTEDTPTKITCPSCSGAGSVDPTLDEQVQLVKKERLWGIFVKLMESKRFQDLVEKNFDIVDRIDEEAKTIETLVIEKPVAVGPKLAPQQLIQMQAAVASSGTKDPAAVMRRILEILGQESSLILTVADAPEDLKRKLDA